MAHRHVQVTVAISQVSKTLLSCFHRLLKVTCSLYVFLIYFSFMWFICRWIC